MCVPVKTDKRRFSINLCPRLVNHCPIVALDLCTSQGRFMRRFSINLRQPWVNHYPIASMHPERNWSSKLRWWARWLAKVVDFVPLEPISGPRSPDPDLARSHMKVTTMEHTKFIEIPLVLLIFWNIQWTINCKVATRVRERSRSFNTRHVL